MCCVERGIRRLFSPLFLASVFVLSHSSHLVNGSLVEGGTATRDGDKKVIENDYKNVAGYMNRLVREVEEWRDARDDLELGVKFASPGVDLVISEHAGGKPRVIQTFNGEIYLLADKRLLHVEHSMPGGRFEFRLVFQLDHFATGDARVIVFKDIVIFAVVVGESISVYAKNWHSKSPGTHIQRLPFPSQTLGTCRFFVKNDELHFVVVSNVSPGKSRISLFKWHESHFISEHELETFVVDDLFVQRLAHDTLLMMVSYAHSQHGGGNKKTMVDVYHLDSANSKLALLQHMYFQSNILHSFQLKQDAYLLACNAKYVCFVFKFRQKKFMKEHQVDRKFTKVVSIISSESAAAVLMPDSLLFYNVPSLHKTIATSDLMAGLERVLFYQPAGLQYLVLFYEASDGHHIRFLEMQVPLVLEEVGSAEAKASSSPVKELLREVRQLLEAREPLVRDIKSEAGRVLRVDKPLRVSELRVSSLTQIASGHVEQIVVTAEGPEDTPGDLLREVEWLMTKTSELKGIIESNGTGRAKREFKKHFQATKMVVKNLHYEGEEFKDPLTRSKDSTVTSQSTIGNLRTLNLHVTNNLINNIALSEIATTSRTADLITGTKEFESVRAEHLSVNFVNDRPMRRVSRMRGNEEEDEVRSSAGTSGVVTLSGDASVASIEIGTVNGLAWREISDATRFDGTITGNLFLTQPVTVRRLEVETVNGFPVASLMTRHTDQEVLSKVVISKFHTESIVTGLVNGIKLNEEVAVRGQENHIQSHVVIESMNVTSGLKLTEEDVAAGHIVGTKSEDLLQLYTGPVVIRGSLTLKDVHVEPECTVLVQDKPFRTDVENIYWVNDAPQNIPQFHFHNSISVVQLHADLINGHPTSDYLFLDRPSKRSRLAFRHVTVPGSLETGDSDTKLAQISRNAVRYGEKATIEGVVRFEGELRVASLAAERINQQKISLLATRNAEKLDFTGEKRVQELRVEGHLAATEGFGVRYFNGTDLEAFFEKAVRIDSPLRAGFLSIGALRIQDLRVNQIQGVAFDEFLSNLNSVLNSSASVRNVKLHGDAFFENDLYVESINEVEVNRYFSLMVRKDNPNVEIRGPKTFQNLVVSADLSLKSVNGVDLQYWQEKALRVNQHQVITGHWTVGNLNAHRLYTKFIDGVDCSSVLLKDAPDQVVSGHLSVDHLIVGNLESTSLPLDNILHRLTNPALLEITHLVVEGPVYYPMGFKSQFTDILTDAVRLDSEQPIYGKVTFISRPTFESIRSKVGLINGIDPLGLHSDALKYSGDKQVVYAPKKFLQPLESKFMIVKIKADVPKINDIDVVALNNSLIRRNEITFVDGRKTFAVPPIIGSLKVDGLINGVDFENLIFIQDPKALAKVTFDDLQIVSDLFVDQVNSYPFADFIHKRVRLTGPPQELDSITFQNLFVSGQTRLQSINDIPIQSLVLLQSTQTQAISGTKNVSRLILDGPTTCLSLNGVDLTEFVRYNVKLDVPETLPYLEGQVSAHGGIEISGTLNGHPVAHLVDPKPRSMEAVLPVIPEVEDLVQSVRESVQGQNKPKRFLFLDFADDIKVVEKQGSLEELHGHQSFVMDGNCQGQVEVKVGGPSKIYVLRHPAKSVALGSGLKVERNTENCLSRSLKITKDGKTLEYKPTFLVQEVQILPEVILLLGQGHVESVVLGSGAWVKKQALKSSATAMKVLNFDSHSLLVLTNPTEVEVLALDKTESWFQTLESFTGSFNLISDLLTVDRQAMIGLGSQNSRGVSIYKLVRNGDNPPLIQFYQALKFDMQVRKLAVLELEGKSHLTVLMTNGHFLIYRFNAIDGWNALTSGFYDGIQAIAKFEHLTKDYLLVTSPHSAAAIIVFQQS